MKNTHSEPAIFSRIPDNIQRQRLHRLIREELTEKQRITLIAYYFQQLSIPEIARQQGINKSSVCRTLHRAEERLRRFLQY